MDENGCGILGMYLYFPPYVVSQDDLEAADGVPGKYTEGLGQRELGFGGDREDVVSMAATAMLRLMEAYDVTPREIGKVEVGTETGVDRSKSIMSYLMQYLNKGGNTTAQGADNVHGCYGGTAALLHALDWASGASWDGRLALVVATDIALYEEGSPARATGGAGAVAMLVGPGAPLVIDPPPWRATFSAHCFDFFKPLSSEGGYPVVDGPATLVWYMRASDACGAGMAAAAAAAAAAGDGATGGRLVWRPQQCEQRPDDKECHNSECHHHHQQQQDGEQQWRAGGAGGGQHVLLPAFDYYVGHSPFNKMVRKTFARLVMQDALRLRRQPFTDASAAPRPHGATAAAALAEAAAAAAAAPAGGAAAAGASAPLAVGTRAAAIRQHLQEMAAQLPASASDLDPQQLPDSSINDKSLERAITACSGPLYDLMVAPAAALQRRLGNLYTASVYSGLAGLLEHCRTGGIGPGGAACGGGAREQQGEQQQRDGSGKADNRLAGHLEAADGSGDGGGDAGDAGGSADRGGGGSSSGDGGGLLGRRVLLFSFGSGVQASLLSLRCASGSGRFTLEALVSKQDVSRRLDARRRRSASDFSAAMASLQAAHAAAPFAPSYGSAEDLEPGAVYLDRVDSSHRRHYARRLR